MTDDLMNEFVDSGLRMAIEIERHACRLAQRNLKLREAVRKAIF